MRYLAMGLASSAVGFVVANSVISFLVVLLWRALRPRPRRAGSLFVLRMLPAIGSIAVVWGLVVPAFWAFEPRATKEDPGSALYMFVILACALVVAGLYRASASWFKTRRLERMWQAAAAGSPIPGSPVAAYRVASAMPFAALVGVLRPRLYVADEFVDALEPGERQAVMAHETGHLVSLDNLKRAVMKLAPDWLPFFPAGREIEAAWAIAAEEDADDHAAGPSGARSLDVAGALLKAARWAPVSCGVASNFCEGPTIARRVARLLNGAPERRAPRRSFASRFAFALAILSAAALFAAPALRAAYTLTEAGIRLLQ